MSTLVKEIKTRLSQYLVGESNAGEFQIWFASLLCDLSPAEPDALALAHAIEWAFADAERGLAAAKVRNNLSQLARPTSAAVVFGPPMVVGDVGVLPKQEWSEASNNRQAVTSGLVLMGRLQILHETASA